MDSLPPGPAGDLPQRSRGTSGVLRDSFLRVAISRAVTYRRAAGFFSSSVFSVVPEEIRAFFERGGTVELVCSPVLSSADITAIAEGLYRPERWHGVPASRIVTRLDNDWPADLLSWSIATRRLHMKVAVVQGSPPRALYHEKFGLFVACDGRIEGFEGSANESANGYVANFERLRILSSARTSDQAELRLLVEEFESLWLNRTHRLDVVDIHEALSNGILTPRDTDEMERSEDQKPVPALRTEPEILRLPSRLRLREHQVQAVDAWFDNGGRGVLEMATGTGKTITALAAMSRVRESVAGPLVIIIVAPFLSLVDQWERVARDFGLRPINCSGDSSTWQGLVNSAIYLVNAGQRNVLSVVTTNATFAGSRFQEAVQRIEARTVLIADEVHNLGARHLRSTLPERITLRLGLSATPDRWMDPEGTTAVHDYFGGSVFRFGLREALDAVPPLLTPYSYFPVIVEFDDDEADEYLRLTRLLARYSRDPEAETLSPEALSLLLRRSRLIGSARRKIPALVESIRPFRESRYNLVYCGDGRSDLEAFRGTSETESEAALLRQVDAVARVLGRDLHMHVARYTSETAAPDRARILEGFEGGRMQALIAIRCLDEGVDVPATRRAFILASSTNPRQFVQRRGRVLRVADGKDRAEIFDFLVAPPVDAFSEGSPEFSVVRNLLRRELGRVVEFARLALNGPQATFRVEPLLVRYGLLDILAEERT